MITLVGGGLLSLFVGAGGFLTAFMALPVVASAFAFFSTNLGRVVLICLGLWLGYTIAFHRGGAEARTECKAEQLASQLAAKQVDLENAQRRVLANSKIIAGLKAADDDNRRKIAELADELQSRPLQSTKPGAKPDANALLDDRCNYTPAGAARDRRMRK